MDIETIIEYLVEGNSKEDLAQLYIEALSPSQKAKLVAEVELVAEAEENGS